MAENRGTCFTVDPAHIFVTDYSDFIFNKNTSPHFMQAVLSQLIIPIKLDSSTLKERGMARWGGLKSKSLVGPPRLRKGMHHHYIHWKFDLTCIVRNIISIWTTYKYVCIIYYRWRYHVVSTWIYVFQWKNLGITVYIWFSVCLSQKLTDY